MRRYSRLFDDDDHIKRRFSSMMRFSDREPRENRKSRRQTVDFSQLLLFSGTSSNENDDDEVHTTPPTPTANKRLSWSSVGSAVCKALSDLYPGTAEPSVYTDTSRLMHLNRNC